MILRLTFDRPMTCDGLLENYTGYSTPCPPPLTNPLFSRDRRTFLTVCIVGKGPGRTAATDWRSKYGSDFDSNGLQIYRVRLKNFTGLSGQSMAPSDLDFYVDTSSPPVMTMQDAMVQDRFLRDAQKAAEQAQVTTLAMVQASPPSAPEPAKAISAEASPTPVSPPSAKTSSERADASATPVSPLTVQAPVSPRTVQDFVTSYGAVTAKLDHYPRWFGPACVAVDGVVPAQAAKFKARVEQVARAVGAPVGPANCNPDIEIAFTNQPQQYIDAVAARNPTVLGYGGDKTVTRPIQAWYATLSLGQAPPAGRELNSQGATLNHSAARLEVGAGNVETERTKDRLGATPSEHNFAAGRRCVDASSPTCPHSVFLNVLVLVDAGKMGDVSLDLTSNYVAMLALSQPRTLDGCMVLPSVIDLYAGACTGRDPPGGLTPADMAYLTSLYAADLTVEKAREQSDIAGRMVKILVPAKGAPASSWPPGAPAGWRGPARPCCCPRSWCRRPRRWGCRWRRWRRRGRARP